MIIRHGERSDRNRVIVFDNPFRPAAGLRDCKLDPRGSVCERNDNAHVEQKNYTHVRQWFGYERHDNQAVVPLINALCKGALGQLLNLFLPSLKLESKRREGSKIKRVYGPAQTPLARVLEREEVCGEKKRQLRALQAQLNPFALRREVDRGLKQIDQARELKG